MHRLVSNIVVTALCFLASGASVYAAEMHWQKQYVVPTSEHMVDFLFANGAIDMRDDRQLSAYVRYKDCALYMKYYNDDFTWNRIKQRILQESQSLQKDVITRFVLKTTFLITRYNFETKSFDFDRTMVMDNVNRMLLLGGAGSNCVASHSEINPYLLPDDYELMLDTPISLYRLPMAESMARKILDVIAGKDKTVFTPRIIFASVYVTADSVLGTEGRKAAFVGRVQRVEFFLDPERTEKIRTLYYDDL